MGSNPILSAIMCRYRLALIKRRKRNWLHAGSNPSRRTTITETHMIEIVSIITSTAVSIFSIIQSVKRMGKKRKDELSTFLVSIANTLDEAADSLSKDVIPYGTCQMMQDFALHLPSVLKGFSDDEHLTNLSHELYRAYNIESLYMLNKTDVEKSYVNELYKAAGKFRAAAVMVDIL